MKMNIISMKQLREEFPSIRERIEMGEKLLLIYRSKPLAEIKPLKKKKKFKKASKKDYSKIVEKLAGGLSLGKDITPDKLNKIYDKQYKEMLSGF